MKKFIVMYHAETAATEQMAKATPEQAKAGMDAWMKWMQECGTALADGGAPLGNGTAVSPKGSSKSDKKVCGYSVLQASSLDEALRLVKNHPHFMLGDRASVEVHEVLPMPGM